MIAAIVMAAGASTRLGEPKQLVTIAGETLLERAVRTANEAGCTPVVVVLGANCTQILGHVPLGDVDLLINADWIEGMASSIRVGIRAVSSAENIDGAVLMTCDQPAVTAAHLHALMAAREITCSAYAGRSGVPAFFPKTTFAALAALRGDVGARDLLHGARTIELRGGEIDIDTAVDLEEAERFFATKDNLPHLQ